MWNHLARNSKMAPNNKVILKLIGNGRWKRRKLLEAGMALALSRRWLQIQAFLLAAVLLISQNNSKVYHRSCRRLPRNNGLWDLIWNTYSDDCFRKTFRVSTSTFNYIFCRIRHKLERQTVCEEPISPECRLAICLYRLGRGDYYYTISEMVGLGQSSVSTIVNEVNEAIVTCMWKECVTA